MAGTALFWKCLDFCSLRMIFREHRDGSTDKIIAGKKLQPILKDVQADAGRIVLVQQM